MATTESAARSGNLSRARILETAAEQFASLGYRGASLRRIAAEVGISQPGLLHHFGSKAALLNAVLMDRDWRDLAASSIDADDLEKLDFAGLLDFMAQIVERNVERRELVQLAHLTAAEASGADHPAHEWVVGRVKYLRGLCVQAIRRGVDDGALRADVDPEVTATLLIAASEGLENQWLLDPDTDMVTPFREFTDLLYRSVAVSEAR
ncbi:TetR/AcrR family transcriptional regulator [Tomitella fengzijianii]|uniref:TetR/AcrR family transcriptional regulator n=1 Tax=Tomitella fengzijianii TaxID=2597660 RepID=A0A516X1W9_9ACTN|nr:TetR/AcrR family transcriptional regulator [Tomitella fengzijianii]QDQ97084.1 TetR/AcrR family transcriptional regulator [Tomitella fengzijianii]